MECPNLRRVHILETVSWSRKQKVLAVLYLFAISSSLSTHFSFNSDPIEMSKRSRGQEVAKWEITS